MLSEIAATLLPSRDSKIEAIREARLAALTDRQRHVLSLFIEWAAAEHPDDIDAEDRELILHTIER